MQGNCKDDVVSNKYISLVERSSEKSNSSSSIFGSEDDDQQLIDSPKMLLDAPEGKEMA